MSTISYSKNESNIKIDEKVGQALYTPNIKIAQLEANQLTGTKITIDNVFVQGVSWDPTTDVYTRLGSLAGLPKSVTAGFANLPIHDAVRRCVKDDAGNDVYMADKNEPFMQEGMDLIDSGIVSVVPMTNKLVDNTKTFLTSNVSVGDFVFIPANIGTIKDYIAKIIAIPSDTELTLDRSGFVGGGETYKIGNFDYLGGAGQVLAKIPKFYCKIYKVAGVHYGLTSKYQLPGYIVHPAFIVNGVEVDFRYLAAFEGSMYDASAEAMTAKGSIATSIYAAGDKMCSVAQQWVKTNETLQEYRSMAEARGAGFHNWDKNLVSAYQLLYQVDYADANSQATIGPGRTNLSGGTWAADSYIGRTGLSIMDGTHANSVSNGGTTGFLTDYMTYLGAENFYGNVWGMVSNIAWDGRWTGVEAAQPVYITNDFSKIIDSSSKNLKKIVNAPYIGAAGGYISDVEDFLHFIPKSVGASSTTKLTDYYYQYSEVGRNYWRLFLVGSYSNPGGTGGFFSVLANNAVASFADVNIGGRLCF